MRRARAIILTAVLCAAALATPGAGTSLRQRDPRNIRTGHEIPDEGYCDQPYVVVTADGNWLCTLTTGPGREGQRGQHVVATISADRGRTWSEPVDIEPSDGPEASWAVPLAAPSGRVYAFYTYNGDGIRTLNGKPIRADTLGWYVYRYSDDYGRTWSDERYRLPMRVTACDRANDWNGAVQLFWGICRPITVGSKVYFAFTKLGKYMLGNGEGWFYCSDNILTESDPEQIHWQLLPEGDHGLRAAEFGSVQEEHNVVALSDGSLHCTYRTTQGFPCHAYSRDGGRSWTEPEPMTYAPGGRRIKNPRACPMTWRTSNGNYLLWFHNHGGTSFRGRNPVWISGGVEKNGHIHWSEPEILLYDPAPNTRMSYPSLVEQDGRYWVTETNKTIARVHEVDPALLAGLWAQGAAAEVTEEGLVLAVGADDSGAADRRLPREIDFNKTGGVTVEFRACFDSVAAGQTVLDTMGDWRRGIRIVTDESSSLRIDVSDGEASASWDSDPGSVHEGRLHHVAIIVDDGPRVISFVIDGKLCDGGDARKQGWGRYEADLGVVAPAGQALAEADLAGEVKLLRVYDRPLRTSEAIANFTAGPKRVR